MKKLSKVSCAFALGLGMLSAPQFAGAQEAAPPPPAATPPAADQAAPVTLEKIEVTGTAIRRTDTETASPVQVISNEQMRMSGYTDTSDVLRNISANGQGTLSQSFGQAFAGGASGVALRGLNLGATLVLIDGHRMAPYPLSDDGQRSFVDISSIPFDSVDHIEVLKDGASAVYGSDAMAGVVNIILKKEFTGLQLNASQGVSGQGDGATTHMAGTGGIGNLSSDGYNLFGSVEFRHQADITVQSRFGQGEWAQANWSGYQNGLNNTPGATNSPYVPYPTTPNGIVFKPGTNNGTYQFLPGANPNCTGSSTLSGTTTVPPAAYSAGACAFNWNTNLIQPDDTNVNLLVRFTKALAGGWKNSLEASQFSNRSEQVGPGFANGDFFVSAISPNPVTLIKFGPSSPLPSLVNYPAITIPAGYPGNPYGAAANINSADAGLGANVTTFNTKTIRVVDEITGTILRWDVTFDAGYTNAKTREVFSGTPQPGLLQQALNNGYVFGQPGANALFAPDMTASPQDELDFLSVSATHDLLHLPGGPLGFAIGAEYIHRNLDTYAPAQIANGIAPGNDAFAVGQQNNGSAYLEFLAPIVKQFELEAAGRFDHYDTGSTKLTPKVGFKYTPITQLSLRGTWGKGFRAPNPAESGNAGQAYQAAATNDPILCKNPGTPNSVGNFPTQCSLLPVGINASNPNLQPETSTNETLGFIWEPSTSLSVTGDWFNIKVNNQIESAGFLGTIPVTPIATPVIVRGPQIVLPYCAALPCPPLPGTLTPVGPIAFIQTPFINATLTQTNGFDFDVRGTYDLHEAGKITADLSGTHVFNYNVTVGGDTFHEAGTHGPSYFSGDTGNPRNRFVLNLAWDRQNWEVAANINYISAISITDPLFSGQDQCTGAATSNGTSQYGVKFTGTPPNNLCKVASFTDVDLTARYEMDKNWSFRGSILNVFDRQPPTDIVTYGGGGGLPYNAALHQAGAVGRYFTAGVAYKF